MSPPAREAWIEISLRRFLHYQRARSPPAREAWIEICVIDGMRVDNNVASREGGVD